MMTNETEVSLAKVEEMLRNALQEVFQTMLSMEVQSETPQDLHVAGQSLVAGSIGFTGEASGIVYINVTAAFARTLASSMLGLPENEVDSDEMVNDCIGELSNMIVGSVKSRLCDTGTPCVLTIPSIVRGQNFSVEPISKSERRLLGFRCGEQHIVVELLLKF